MRTLVALILVIAALHATADEKAGEKEAQLCLLCHKPGSGHPLLEAQPAKYLVAAITAYKTGKRSDPVMRTNVAALSARDVSDIANYFASRSPPTGDRADAAKAAAGESRARDLKCATCQGSTFSGADPVPRLAGQVTGYLIKQLEAFAAGRRTHPGAEMLSSEGEIESIAHYFTAMK